MSENAPQSSIVLYQTEDGHTRIQCRFENDTMWLTQALIAELFQKDVRTINEHQANMGLTAWKGDVVRKGDVTVAKNYLREGEIDQLNRVVVMFLDFAEDQAKRRKQIFLHSWQSRLDDFLTLNERHSAGSGRSESRSCRRGSGARIRTFRRAAPCATRSRGGGRRDTTS